MLRLTVLELPSTWGEPRAALGAVAAELARGPATDLVLLPEQSLNGYVSPSLAFDLTRFAEPIDGPTRCAVSALARAHATAIVAPLVLREGAHAYNAMIACDRDGELVFAYRKHHPWHPERWAMAGETAPFMATLAGVRVVTAICYDLHFLEADSGEALDAADLLLFPSAWVDEHDDRHVVLPALARRHRIAVANANWSEGVVRAPGQGRSSIHGPGGELLASTSLELAPRAIARLDASLELTKKST